MFELLPIWNEHLKEYFHLRNIEVNPQHIGDTSRMTVFRHCIRRLSHFSQDKIKQTQKRQPVK
jgi:hypothetical protein